MQHFNGQVIGRGRTAAVYACGPGRVLKLFYEGRSSQAVRLEAAAGALARRGGAGAPRVDALVQLDRRFGIVFERVDGTSMLDTVARQPWLLPVAARQLAALHAAMHRQPATGLPSQRERLRRDISRAGQLPAATRERALDRLGGLPDSDRLCHGDFHPDNVVLTARGPVVIDWLTAVAGNPLADVARTRLLLTGGALPPGSGRAKWLLALFGRQAFYALYLRHYAALMPLSQKELDAWRLPVAAARLAEDIKEEEAALVRQVIAAIGRGE